MLCCAHCHSLQIFSSQSMGLGVHQVQGIGRLDRASQVDEYIQVNTISKRSCSGGWGELLYKPNNVFILVELKLVGIRNDKSYNIMTGDTINGSSQ